MPSDDPRLKTPARKALRATVAKECGPCWRCGLPIDYSLPWPHLRSYVLDEIISRDDGGDPLDPQNVAPAHLDCNARAGAAITNRKRRFRRWGAPTPLNASRDW
jgi:hypothetical protein